MTTFKDARTGAAITVKTTAGGPRNRVLEVLEDGTLHIQLAAPAEAGALNAALVEFLAGALGLPAGQVEIVAGLSADRKLISLLGVTPAEVDARLTAEPPARPQPARRAAKPTPKPKAKAKPKTKTTARPKRK